MPNSKDKNKKKDDSDIKIPSVIKLQEERDEKTKSKNNVFKVILNKCIEKITYTNRYTDKTFIIFEVPKVLIGYPSYDMHACISYIISKLSNSGYIVEFMEPFYLYIDWGSAKREVDKKNSYHQTTRTILEKFPNASKIEFVYEDTLKKRTRKKK